MKRLACVLLLVAVACGGSGVDQGTVNICHSIIGFDRTSILSADSWMKVALATPPVAKNSVVKKAAQDILRVDTPYLLRHGFNDRVKAAYIAAINQMFAACMSAGGFKGKVSRFYG